VDLHILHPFHQPLADEEIIQAPADIPRPCVGPVGPPGILHLVGIERTVGIHKSMLQIPGDPNAFLRQKTGIFFVFLRIRQVDLVVGGVEVASEDHLFSSGVVRVADFKQAGVKVQLKRHAFVFLPAVREVDRVEEEIRILHADGAPFVVESLDPEPGLNAEGLLAVEHRRAAVARSFGGMPEAAVLRMAADQFRHLIGLGFDLLQTEDIRLDFVQPGKAVLVNDRPNSIDIPCCNSHSARPFKAYGKLIV